MRQDLFGHKETKPDGTETVGQQWMLLAGEEKALAVVNTGLYAHDFADNALRVTLLHSPAYCAHPVDDRVVLPQDRYLPRIDIGERSFKLVLLAGDWEMLRQTVDARAQEENELPFALSFFPSGKKTQTGSGLRLSNPSVLLSAATRKGDGYLLRLFNPTFREQTTCLSIPALGVAEKLCLAPVELRTLLLEDGALREVLLDGSEIR